MKVLKKGKPWSLTVMCTGVGNGDGGCGAQLELVEGDLYITESHARDESTSYVTFRCIECKAETDVGRPKVPARILSNLPKKASWRRARGENVPE